MELKKLTVTTWANLALLVAFPLTTNPLGDNGGLAQTQALNASSPAIDAGDPTGCGDGQSGGLPRDQRGYLRPVDGGSGQTRCDLGAFEFGATAPAPPEWRLYLPLIRR